jgi:hypothetical protein
MKKFISTLLLFSIIFFVIDKLFIIVVYYSADTEIDKRLERLINGRFNKDIIVMGSSRGARNIIAGQMEKETSRSVYNLSYPGSDIIFHEFILKTLVTFNKSPETILLAVDDNIELLPNDQIVFRLDRLYPLIKYSYIREELANKGETNKYLSKIFMLHLLNRSNFNLKKKKFTPLDTLMNCGSMPISFQKKNIKWKFNDDERMYHAGKELKSKVDAFTNFIKICKHHGIHLVIVFSPNYQAHSKSFERRLRQLAGDEVDFFTYNTENVFYHNRNYFYDEGHLQRRGAEIFTGEIITFLNDLRN